MNRRSPGFLISKAVPKTYNSKPQRGSTPGRSQTMSEILKQWLDIQGNRDLRLVTMQNLRDSLNYIRTEMPHGTSPVINSFNAPVRSQEKLGYHPDTPGFGLARH